MPNPKLETYKNKATGTVYDYTDAAAQASIAAIEAKIPDVASSENQLVTEAGLNNVLNFKEDKVPGKGLSTNDYDDTEKAKVAGAFSRSEQAVLGAKNFLPNNAVSKTNNGVTWTVDQNGVITANGTAEGSNSTNVLTTQFLLKAGSYILSGAKSQYEFIQIYMANSPYTEIARDTGNGALVNVATDILVNAIVAVSVGTTVNNSVYKPMLRLASDPDDTYVPYAMTNKELTEKVRGIINAVTNAADFAAFKTAIGNL